MRTKVTLILVLLNVAVFAWIVHSRHRWQLEATAADRDRHPLRELAVNLQAITISDHGGTAVRLERRAGKPWNLAAPVDWLANPAAVEGIIGELQNLESVAVLDLAMNKQTPADFDLDKPDLTFVLTAAPADATAPSPAPVTIRLSSSGKGGKLYLLAPDGTHVHVLDGALLERLKASLGGLPASTIFSLRPFEIRFLSLQKGTDAPVRLLRRDDARWLLDSPITTRAAKPAIETTLKQLLDLRLGADRSGGNPGFAPVGSVPTEALSELRISLEGDNRHEVLLLGQPIPKASAGANRTPRYAKLEDRAPVFALAFPNDLFETLRHAQETLRDTHVLDFDPATVSTVTLSAPSQPEPLVLRRLDATTALVKGAAPDGADWQIVRPSGALPADATLVKNFLLWLAEQLRATSFVNDAPAKADTEKLGFNRPERELTLAFAPGTTPAKLTLEIALDDKAAVYARVFGQPFIYAVSLDSLRYLSVAPSTYRDRLVRALPESAQITALTLAPVGTGVPVFSHILADKETWNQALENEPPARKEALRSILLGDKDHPALLRQLRAVHFASDTFDTNVLVNGTLRPWSYSLTTTLALPGGAAGATTTTTSTLWLAERAGSIQLAGSPKAEADTVFELEPLFMDALDALLNSGHAHDPAPATSEKPTVATPPAN